MTAVKNIHSVKNQKSYDHLGAEKAFEKIQYLFIEKTQLIRYRRNVLNIITAISEKSTAYITLSGKSQVNVLEISNIRVGTFLVVQWLRLCAPLQGAWVRSLFGEVDSTC